MTGATRRALLALLLAAAAAAPRPVAAQDPPARDLAVRDEISPASGARYSDVWGVDSLLLLGTYTAADAAQNGLYLVNAANPDSLRLLSHLATTDPPRDVTAVDTLCLLAFEPGFPTPPRPAVLLASIATPAAPRIVGAYRSDSVSQVHNAWLAPPYAYLACSSTGDLRILDVSDPAAPREVASWSTSTPDHYLHDVITVDTLAYLSYWKDGLRVLSVADPTRPFEVGRYAYPGALTHSTAISTDGTTAYVSDEIFAPPYGAIHVLDISDLSDIREVKTWICPSPDASVHNLAVLGDRLYVAHYTCGVRVLDVSTPLDPIEVAFNDLDPPTGRLGGFWGVFPAPPSGNLVYASHMDRGAILLDLRRFRTLTVAADGVGDFATIAAALEAAGVGDTVRVAAGVYREHVVMRSGVVLEGAGPAETVIDAGDGFGPGLVVVGAAAGTRVARLSVTGARAADLIGGSGVFILRASVVVESVAVFDNESDTAGGGLLVEGGDVELRSVRAFGNRAVSGGGVACVSRGDGVPATLRLVDCSVTDNTALGRGGGLLLSGPTPVEIVRTTIARNRAGYGGGVAAFDAPFISLVNTRVAWNRASAGGGLYGEASDFQIENGIVSDNTASEGGALSGGGAEGVFAELRDAVVSGNRGGATFSAGAPSAVTFDYCDLFGNGEPLVTGSLLPPNPAFGNVAADPLFVAPTWESLDYFPSAGSPLIDSGTPDDADLDLDATRQDIGVGGGSRSGWTAPRVPPGLAVMSADNYRVTLTTPYPEAAASSLAVYRALEPPVPLTPMNRVALLPAFLEGCDGTGCEWSDTTVASTDSVVFYRIVPEDAGHAGSPSSVLTVRPQNRPPLLRVSLSLADPFHAPNDSMRVRIDASEPLADIALELNGRPTETRPLGTRRQVSEAIVPIEPGPLRVIASALDAFALAGSESLSGDLAHLVPAGIRAGESADGAFRFTIPDLDRESLFLVRGSPVSDLPGDQAALTDGFEIEPLGATADVKSLDIVLRGPSEVAEDEAIVLLQSPPYLPRSFPARADPGSGLRSARVAIPIPIAYSRPRFVLAAPGAGTTRAVAMRIFPPSPNPFSESVRIRLDLDRAVDGVSVTVFDLTGRRVRTLYRGALPRGHFSFDWDGRDDAGSPAASGRYLIRREARGAGQSVGVLLVR